MRSDEEFARRLQRLVWDCRRGMKETEVLLSPFREARFASLSRADQESFLDLLDCSDADLFAWFAGGEQPADPALARMVDLVLADAAARG
ncbi:MAG: succinate dehydrogenase assembly factor 2 [Pseudomonadota bacterium]